MLALLRNVAQHQSSVLSTQIVTVAVKFAVLCKIQFHRNSPDFMKQRANRNGFGFKNGYFVSNRNSSYAQTWDISLTLLTTSFKRFAPSCWRTS